MIITLISLSSTLLTVASQPSIDCKTSSLINPCHCVNEQNSQNAIKEIICSDIFGENLDLKLISHRLQNGLNSGKNSLQILIEKLIIRNTTLKHIRSEVFSKIGFQTIEIIDNPRLEFIDKNAFDGSIYTAQELKLINNQKLHDSKPYERDIWSFMSKFTNLREIRLIKSSLHSIPDNAFQPTNGNQNQLRHIEITHSKIDRIGDFAFSELTSQWLNLILSHNRIHTIKSSSFKFSKRSEEVISSINLSNNLLTEDSFESGSFLQIGRPIGTLYLRHNQIKTLDEKIFGPLFDRSDKNFFRLELESNPIVCDCSLQWLFKTKYCYSEEAQSKSALVNDQISIIKCGANQMPISLRDFRSCPKMEEKLSPSCLKSTNINLGFSYHSINLYVINALIVFSLTYAHFCI